ncbi:MAG: glycosyltransferase family 2 protein [Bacteroidales bacterium]|nr:glycosyltransferase family 2 protein [Candidatus Cryptobacteroides onthequi]
MKKTLSIVVPTYNMEKYLARALDSICLSSHIDDIEVIIVNDGSKDKSSEIAHGFQDKYVNSIIVIDKTNGNYGSCINAGLKVATGRYIKILDSDDYLETNGLDSLMSTLTSNDVDLVISNYTKEYTGGKTINYEYDLPHNVIVHFANICKTKATYDLLLPAITYRTQILKDIDYHQTEGISYTDTEWCFTPMTQVNTVIAIKDVVYRYQLGREGQTMDPTVYSKSIPQRIQCFIAMLRSIEGMSLPQDKLEFTSTQLVKHARYLYNYYLIENPEENRSLLIEMDGIFKSSNPDAYVRCNALQYRLHIPYHHIKDWRENNRAHIPSLFIFANKILNFIGSARIKLFLKNNPNEER